MKKILFCFLLFAFCFLLQAQPFHLHLTPSPGETNNAVLSYDALWSATNTSAAGQLFASIPVGTTNVAIPATVPSPSYLLVLAVGTNGVRSTNLNWVVFNTNTLWPLVTNLYQPPPPPGGGLVITNN